MIYDNSCNLHQYVLNREPHFFETTMFLGDRFHWANHTGIILILVCMHVCMYVCMSVCLSVLRICMYYVMFMYTYTLYHLIVGNEFQDAAMDTDLMHTLN